MDLATIGEVCRVSGGQMYKFNYFSVSEMTETESQERMDRASRLKMMANVY